MMAKSKHRSTKREPHRRAVNPVRIDAQCPGCGGIFKMNVGSGRFQSHAWLNGCEGAPPKET
jgi:hypothetical protein